WFPLSTGVTGPGPFTGVLALTVMPDGDLVAAGAFTSAGGVAANNIARWNGSSWQPLWTGLPGAVYAMAVFDNELMWAGQFGVAGNNIARWNGSSWQPLGAGLQGALGASGPIVTSLTVFGGALIAGGQFTLAGGQPAACVARWTG